MRHLQMFTWKRPPRGQTSSSPGYQITGGQLGALRRVGRKRTFRWTSLERWRGYDAFFGGRRQDYGESAWRKYLQKNFSISSKKDAGII